MKQTAEPVKTTYVFGNGNVSTGAGLKLPEEIPYISFSKLDERHKIGENILYKDVKLKEQTMLLFKNLESLAVLEEAVKYVKKTLKKQQKLLDNGK